MSHTHTYDQAHEHRNGVMSRRGGVNSRLMWVLAITAGFMVAEFVGGLVSNSLALLADAGHMLSDAASLGLALFAMWLATRPSGSQHTYGYYRSEILAALLNGAALIAISLFIFVEAYGRFVSPVQVKAILLTGVASGGLVVNLIGLWLLHGSRSESLNVQGAWLHILADTLGSFQAIGAGLLIWAFGWTWADPLASVLIGVLIIFSSWSLLKEALSVLMESSPVYIDVDEVHRAMRHVGGATQVHDLHVWTITSGMIALSAHVLPEPGYNRDHLLRDLTETLREKFGISHVTIQIESSAHECEPCC